MRPWAKRLAEAVSPMIAPPTKKLTGKSKIKSNKKRIEEKACSEPIKKGPNNHTSIHRNQHKRRGFDISFGFFFEN